MSVCFNFIALLAIAFSPLAETEKVVPQNRQSVVEIAAVGDILLDRGVRRSIARFGPAYPFEKTARLLSEADIAFGNLENPLTGECQPLTKKYVFRAEPEHAGILSRAGLDILSLANNHTADCGQVGLANTVEVLARHDLKYVGAGLPGSSNSTAIVKAGGLRIGFAAFTAIVPVRSPDIAVYGVSIAEPEDVSRVVAELRDAADVVFVSFHWGAEYALEPGNGQTDLALMAVEAGADIVLGHHPHVLQGIQLIDRGSGKAIVAYSLGNFVFDPPVRLNRLTGESMILKLRVNRAGLTGAEVVPVVIEGHRPVIATGKSKDVIEKRIKKLSKPFGTRFNGGRIEIGDQVCAKGGARR